MNERACRRDQGRYGQNSVTFIAEPIAYSAAQGWRKIAQRAIWKARGLYRSLQERQRNGCKQRHAYPIKSSFHKGLPRPLPVLRIFRTLVFSIGAPVLLAGCSESELSGQVIAEIDGQEVTLRELQETIRSQKSANGAEPDKQAALDELVHRKILVAEAHERGIEQKESFHFSMRQMRERLLVAELKRELLLEKRDVTHDQITRFISQNPWRFEERFTAVISRGEQAITIDSFDFSSRPKWMPNALSAGADVTIEGVEWIVEEVLSAPLTGEQARSLARNAIVIEGQAKQLEQIIANHRHSGQIRYQTGYGPAH